MMRRTNPSLGRRVGGWLAYLTPMVLVAVVAVVPFGCAMPAAAPSPVERATVDTVLATVDVAPPPVPVTIRAVTTPAVASVTAEAAVERTTTIPPDPCGPEAHAYVDTLPYQPDNKAPTYEAYRVVATCAGWTQATQDFYQEGIISDIFPGESRQCPFVVGNQGVAADCTPTGHGNGEDTGFFQITSEGWGRNALLCKAGLYCSSASIIASPWDSMNAGLQLIMLSQPTNFPWNWNAASRLYHPSLGHWPKVWENLP